MASFQSFQLGKVRNSTCLDDGTRIIHTTNRVSAFDCVLPLEVPRKGEILQTISLQAFLDTQDILENHIIGVLDADHVLTKEAAVIPIEVVVRRYLTGSLWRLYANQGPQGLREAYGVDLPEGLPQNHRFKTPIFTPTTKPTTGRDTPVTPKAAIRIIEQFLTAKGFTEDAPALWNEMEEKAQQLFHRGESLAEKKKLILVDTKYEMGLHRGQLMLVDEVHTPDSSRFWHQEEGTLSNPVQLSKEFLREELIQTLGTQDITEESLRTLPQWKDKVFKLTLASRLSRRYEALLQKLVPEKRQCDSHKRISWPVDRNDLQRIEELSVAPRNILICGNGGRDFSLFQFFANLPEVFQVFCAPGGRHWQHPKYRECHIRSVKDIVNFALENDVGLVVSGPEAFLAEGLYEACEKAGVPCVGPDLRGASLESSKILWKQLMETCGAPTADAKVVSWRELRPQLTLLADGKDSALKLPCVLKYDGLAGGKGVCVLKTQEDAASALHIYTKNMESWHNSNLKLLTHSFSKQKGEPHLLVESLVSGSEMSAIALCHGTHFRMLPYARDHKARNDGQTGPNTGGMGTVAPVPVDDSLDTQFKDAISRSLQEMEKQGCPYYGFIFAGFMVDKDKKALLLEYNVRLGDPEAQVLLPSMGREFLAELQAVARKTNSIYSSRSGTALHCSPQKRIFLVGASPEYPYSSAPKRLIRGIDRVADNGSVFIPSAVEPGNVTSGGRAFGVLSQGKTFAEAREKAYNAIQKIKLEETDTQERIAPHFRNDIGADVAAGEAP